MSASGLMVLVTTFKDQQEAEKVATLLVDAGLAVCAQVGSPIKSFYRWEGRVQDGQEIPVVLKVLAERLELCAGELKLQHSYDVPQIVAWPATLVDRDYLEWARGRVAE